MYRLERILKLQELMERNGIDVYIITKFDPHQTEYGQEYWNGIKFLSGFSGSVGTVLVTRTGAGLWTDGRYYLQAEQELEGSGIELHRASDPGVKDYDEYAADLLESGSIGFDGRTMSLEQVKKLKNLIKDKKIELKTQWDLLGEIWEERPKLLENSVYIHDIKFCGMNRKDKLAALRKKMNEEGIDSTVISSLDDIAWLYNLRGNDAENLTVFTSFSIVGKDSAILFISEKKIETIKSELEKDGVSFKEYEQIYEAVENLEQDKKVAINAGKTNYFLYTKLYGKKLIERAVDFTSELKAIKNAIELENFRRVVIRDGVAMVKFIKWLKEAVKTEQLTEYSAAEHLAELRSKGENYLCISFGTIAGYMENGAINHYGPNKENSKEIKPEGLILVDSGGNYLDGTTDITRTISLGSLTEQMKIDFTFVLKCHISLATVIFPHGTTGYGLDAIARKPMWDYALNYQHGTGHGIGFCLNVHEGPHSISARSANLTKIEAGMLTTNEPGLYRKGEYGIRIENIIIAQEHEHNEFGEFLKFDTCTYCPIDIDAICCEMLNEEEKRWLNNYHNEVFEKLSPHLERAEADWLKEHTRNI